MQKILENRRLNNLNGDTVMISKEKVLRLFNDVSEEETETEKAPVDNELLATINEKVSYMYPYAEYTRTAIKYSASRIDKENETLYVATESPAFLGKDELTPAQRGTLLHRFMEK